MKGSFVISQGGRPAWRSLFQFRAYDYGPFDTRVYTARDHLLRDGLLTEEKPGRYPTYSLTELGRARVEDLEETLGPHDANWVRSVGRYVTSKSFTRLLDE